MNCGTSSHLSESVQHRTLAVSFRRLGRASYLGGYPLIYWRRSMICFCSHFLLGKSGLLSFLCFDMHLRIVFGIHMKGILLECIVCMNVVVELGWPVRWALVSLSG